MSVWKKLRDSAISGAGFAIGASAGRDLYETAKKKVKEVDWEKVQSNASDAVERLGQSVQDLAATVQEQVSPAPQPPPSDEAVRQAEDMLREAQKAPEEPLKRTL